MVGELCQLLGYVINRNILGEFVSVPNKEVGKLTSTTGFSVPIAFAAIRPDAIRPGNLAQA